MRVREWVIAGRPGTMRGRNRIPDGREPDGNQKEGGELSTFFARRSRSVRSWLCASSVVLALLVAACGGSDEVATVDGSPVTFDEVAALIPPEGDTVDTELFARSLMLVISYRVLESEARQQFGLEYTEADIDAMVEDLLAQTGLTEEEVLTTYNLTEASLRSIGAQQLLAEGVIDELLARRPDPTEEELRRRFEATAPDLTQVCAAHILLETEAEADEALERARAGEDFADLAVELSVGPSGPNGGDLGCASPGGYVVEFADATLAADLGVPYGPVETQFGWHVILVSDRVIPSFEETRARLAEEMKAGAGEQLWIEWLTESLTAADVHVEPEYGTWTTEPQPNVIPPGS